MNSAVEMGSGAMIYAKFHKDWFRHSRDNRGGGIHRQLGDRVSFLLFFQNKESTLKSNYFVGFKPGLTLRERRRLRVFKDRVVRLFFDLRQRK
jgi:hypothetical protein